MISQQNIQSCNDVIVAGNRVVKDGIELPPVPSTHTGHNSTIINGKVFIDGYEWKNNKWRRTLRALYHLYF